MNKTEKAKAIVLISVSVVLFCTILFVFLKLTYFKDPVDVKLTGFDGQECIVFEKAAAFTDKNGNRKLFVPYEPGTFEKYIHNSEYYLYSIAEDGSRSDTDTGKYLLYRDNRYFIVEHSSYIKVTSYDDSIEETPYECYYYDELYAQNYVPSSKETQYVFIPAIIDNKLLRDDSTFVKWSDTAGLSSFEDLKEYYKNIEDKYYSFDEYSSKCIILNDVKNPENKGVARLYAKDDGIYIERRDRF